MKYLAVSGIQLVVSNLDKLIEIDVVMSKPVFGFQRKCDGLRASLAPERFGKQFMTRFALR